MSIINNIIDKVQLDLDDSLFEKINDDNTSGLSLLDDMIGEMEAVVCHEETSVESLGLPHERGVRIGMRRGASRELATTVTRQLSRPEDEVEGRDRTKRSSRLRREASNDLSDTITGKLKREDNPQIKYCAGERSKEELSKHAITPCAEYTENDLTVNWVDIRVGKIINVTKHDSADKLYCETIDVGEPEPRSIASGLVPHYSLSEMEGRMVVVVCNLKPRNLCGFVSNGMVLCAESTAGDVRTVELLNPPPGSKPGDRVFAAGLPGEPVTPQKCDKKKIFQKVAEDLRVDEMGRLTWRNVVLRVSDLPAHETCRAAGLTNANVA